jgi:hypothetical protein
MRAILRNLAEAHIETARLNTLLPGDVERIKTADSIARAREALPRKNIREKEIDLWVRIETGMPIPDQTAVTDLGNGIGTIPSASNAGIFKCAKRRYRQVEYQPEEVAERVEPLIAVLRLPHFDRPGFAWNGGHVRNPQAALELLDRNERGSKRQVLTELVAEAPWTTPVIQRPSPQTNKAAAVSGD